MKNRHTFLLAMVALFIGAPGLFVLPAQATTFQYTNVSNNSTFDSSPQVSGDNIIWETDIRFGIRDIFYFDGVTTTNVSNTASNDDAEPRVSGDHVVWQGWDGSDVEIFHNNGGTTAQLTSNSLSDNSPRVSGDNVVWVTDDGDEEIFFYDGTTTTQLTSNSFDDRHPQISGDNVAWRGWDGSDWEVFYYDGTTM